MLKFAINKFNKNAFGYVEVLSRLLNWAVLPLVSFIITPNVFGEVVLIYSFIVFSANVGLFGQNKTILVYGARDKFIIFYPIFLILFFSQFISIFINTLYEFGLIFILASCMSSCLLGYSYYYRVKDNVFSFSILRIGQSLSRLVFISAFLIYDASIEFYLYAEILGMVFTVLLLNAKNFFSINLITKILIVRGKVCHRHNLADLKLADLKLAFIFGLPIFIHTAIINLSGILDKMIITYWFGSEALANYYFAMVFCSCVGFYYAFTAQRYEVRVYRTTKYKHAIKIVKCYLSTNLIFSSLMAFPFLLIYYAICFFSKKYNFDFIIFVLCYIFSVFSLVPICISFIATSMGKNILILYSSIVNIVSFLVLVLVFMSYFGEEIYFIPLAGIISQVLLMLLVKIIIDRFNKAEG